MAKHECQNENNGNNYIDKRYLINFKLRSTPIQTAREFLNKIGALYFYKESDNKSILWRGQGGQYIVSPGIHSRIKNSGEPLNDDNVIKYTQKILSDARSWGLGRLDGVELPDMPLLALLQHNYIATPLLDVSLDPLTALLMGTMGDKENPGSHDENCGVLMSMEAPYEKVIEEWDTRSFEEVYKEVCDDSEGGIYHYKAPYVTARLRIQRGSFLLSSVKENDVSTIGLEPVRYETDSNGLAVPDEILEYVEKIVKSAKGKRKSPYADGVIFMDIHKNIKGEIRDWLFKAAGLDYSYVYPEAMSGRFYEEFMQANRRNSPLPKIDKEWERVEAETEQVSLEELADQQSD